MLFLLTAAFAEPPPEGTWVREDYTVTVTATAKGPEVKLIHAGDVLSQWILEGEHQTFSAPMDGCGGTFMFPNDGRLMLELDGPECPILFAGTYPAKAPGVCPAAAKAAFDCPVKGGKRLTVCQASDGALAYTYGKPGTPELALTNGRHVERMLARGTEESWVFTNDVWSYTVFEVEAGPDSGRGVLIEKSGKAVTTVSCMD